MRLSALPADYPRGAEQPGAEQEQRGGLGEGTDHHVCPVWQASRLPSGVTPVGQASRLPSGVTPVGQASRLPSLWPEFGDPAGTLLRQARRLPHKDGVGKRKKRRALPFVSALRASLRTRACALPERKVTLHSGDMGDTQALSAREGACLGRSVTSWTSASGSWPGCSTARRWPRCARSSASPGRRATRSTIATKGAGSRASRTAAAGHNTTRTSSRTRSRS